MRFRIDVPNYRRQRTGPKEFVFFSPKKPILWSPTDPLWEHTSCPSRTHVLCIGCAKCSSIIIILKIDMVCVMMILVKMATLQSRRLQPFYTPKKRRQLFAQLVRTCCIRLQWPKDIRHIQPHQEIGWHMRMWVSSMWTIENFTSWLLGSNLRSIKIKDSRNFYNLLLFTYFLLISSMPGNKIPPKNSVQS